MTTKSRLLNSSVNKVMNISRSMIAIFTLLTLSSFIASGCETAAATSVIENRTMNNTFYGLILKTNAQVILSQGMEPSVRIEGDRENVSSVQTSVENGALVIDGNNTIPVTVYVTVDEINLIEVDGAGKIFSNQPINSDLLLLKVSGSGLINVDIRALSLGMIVKGSGRINAQGSTVDSYVRVMGSGKVISKCLDSIKSETEANAEKHIRKNELQNVNRRGVLRLHQ